MIGIITAVVLAAQPAQQIAHKCEMIGEAAASVMEGRQDGIALSAYMSRADEVGGSGGDLIKAIALAAYSQPRYSVQKNQDRAVQNFRNTFEAACYGKGV